MLVDQIAAKMLAKGIAMQSWMSHFVLAPPLIIEKSQIDEAVDALDEALLMADALLQPELAMA